MQIHLFRQPIFFFARRLIHPMLSQIGITPTNINTYNRLWDITTNVSRSAGLSHSLYLTWNIRRLLLGRVTPQVVNNLLNNYNQDALNLNILNLLTRVSNNLPFRRIINYILFSIIGNIFNFFVKRFILSTIFAALTTIFSSIAGTLAIFWIPAFREVTTFLRIGFKLKEIIDSYLPFGLKIPIPEFLNYKKFIFSLVLYSFLNFITPIWLKDLINFLNIPTELYRNLNNWSPINLNRFSFLYYPVKNVLYFIGYNIWNFLEITPAMIYNKFKSVFKFFTFKKEAKEIIKFKNNENNVNIITIPKFIVTFLFKFLAYLYQELNLF